MKHPDGWYRDVGRAAGGGSVTAVMLPCELADAGHAEVLCRAAWVVLRDPGQTTTGGFGGAVFVTAGVIAGTH